MMRRRAWTLVRCAVAAAAVALSVTAAPLHAQDARIRAQRDTLDRIRREREDLERRAAELQSTAHDLGEEVTNLNRRAEVTARIVKTLEAQLLSISSEADSAAERVAATEQQLAARREALQHRLVDIYKRGPMATSEAMLSARSFGEIVARYKYLHLLALRDRSMVNHVEQLRDQVAQDHNRLVSLQSALETSRADKLREEENLRSLERAKSGSLANTKQQARQTQDRLAKLRKTELQMTGTLASLESDRRRVESERPAAARTGSTIKTSDYGKLDWPVDGPLVYTFGKAQTASNATIRWNGVGIKAAVNTSVHAVAAGKVVSVGQLGTYGLTVIIDHGGGDYSIYGSLSKADVRQNQTIGKGDIVGGVGMSDPELPAHLHFEIRHGDGDGRTPAVDPAIWLQGRR
jgi:septal ring factor EnvC (AmiA/AmiB activator)